MLVPWESRLVLLWPALLAGRVTVGSVDTRERRAYPLSQPIHRTLDTERPAAHHVKIDHRRGHVAMDDSRDSAGINGRLIRGGHHITFATRS